MAEKRAGDWDALELVEDRTVKGAYCVVSGKGVASWGPGAKYLKRRK